MPHRTIGMAIQPFILSHKIFGDKSWETLATLILGVWNRFQNWVLQMGPPSRRLRVISQSLARAWNPPRWFIILCDLAKTWPGWLYRQLGAHLPIRTPSLASDFMYNLPNQFSLDKWKKVVTPCLRLRRMRRHSQLEFLLLMPPRTSRSSPL